jgi:glycosyltransferase involved in cell wall biosynthesis
MLKLGVVINETWSFFKEIYEHLGEHHHTTLYQPKEVSFPFFRERIQRAVFKNDYQSFLRSQDVVFYEWAGELLTQASHLPKTTPLVTRLHRYEMYHWADHIQWDTINRVILVSRAKEREFARRFPAHVGKVVVIPEAISLQRFQPHVKPFGGDIGILCHLSPRKRVYELILAFAEISRRQPDLHLHIGGGRHPKFGDYYDALHLVTQKLNLQDRVTFYGPVSDPQEWYKKVDIFISNSYSEGLQVSPMEAVANGCYCLSHDWDGADELLPAENLYLTDSQLADKVLSYCNLSEADRRRRLDGLRERVCENFNLDEIKVQIRQVIEEAAGSRG